MPEIEFKLTAIDEASSTIDRVAKKLNSLNSGYAGAINKGNNNAGMGARGGPTGGGPAGMDRAFGKGMLDGLSKLTIVGYGVKEILGRVFNVLKQASPYLQAAMNMLNDAVMLYLRPLGDRLARLLMPMAEAMVEDAESKQQWYEENPDALWGPNSQTEAVSKADDDFNGFVGGLNTWWNKNIGKWLNPAKPSNSIEGDSRAAEGSPTTTNMSPTLTIAGKEDSGWTWENIVAPLTGFGAWLWQSITKGLGDIAAAIGGFPAWLWTEITTGIGDISGTISGFPEWLWESITGALSEAWDKLTGFAEWIWLQITTALSNVYTKLTGTAAWLWGEITRGLGTIATSLGGFLGSVGGFASWLWGCITTGLGSITTGLGSAIGSVGGFASWMWGEVTAGFGDITAGISGLLAGAGNFGSWVFNKITSGLGAIGTELLKFPGWIYGKITGGLSDLYTTLTGIPKAIWNGMVDALQQISIDIPLLGEYSPFAGIPRMATGGIVTSPTVALIGEAGPEAVIPISKMASMGKGDTHNITVNINAPVYGVMDLEMAIREAVSREYVGFTSYR